MDPGQRDFMTKWLSEWIRAVDEYTSGHGIERQAAEDRALELVPRVLAIIQRERPDIETLYEISSFGGTLDFRSGRRVAMEVRGAVRTKELTELHLGNSAPRLSADGLHPRVWEAARAFWKNGHRTTAVQTACTAINEWVQDRVGRKDVSDSGLMAQAFSSDPPKPNSPRLRWPGNPSDTTVRSMNDGIRQYAVGCFKAIRNTSTHTTDEMDEMEALSKLTSISLLATWIEECELETLEEPPPF
ncbi:TIGR02391 family protein [Kocuria sp. CPCC 205263]|uniref:TIGR02391 family protein n=1 Tax=Kocuria sp. CPCC 205263 TaxID=3073555 RepID=UPI0034D50298